jgi:hypothetical protein
VNDDEVAVAVLLGPAVGAKPPETILKRGPDIPTPLARDAFFSTDVSPTGATDGIPHGGHRRPLDEVTVGLGASLRNSLCKQRVTSDPCAYRRIL